MPFKSQEDARRWDREYYQERRVRDQKEICDLEGALIDLVEKEPGRWDIFTIWRYHFQPRGFTFKTVKLDFGQLGR
jgi:hypothetical protein